MYSVFNLQLLFEGKTKKNQEVNRNENDLLE